MLISKLFPFLSQDLAMDLGTANTLLFTGRGGLLVNEPSVVALDRRSGKVMAVGAEAKSYLGRAPKAISVVRPLRDGVIADFDVTRTMISTFIRKAVDRWTLIKPRIVIGVPTCITQVEKRAVIESAEQAGCREVRLVEEPMAAAIGADLPVREPRGSMVLDIGGGTSEVGVITMSAIAYFEAARIAGDEMNEAVQRYMQETFKVLVGENTAEKIKMNIGSAIPLDEPLSMQVSGKYQVDGSPRAVTVTDGHIREALAETVRLMVNLVLKALEKTPPELVRDVFDNGMLLAGGGGLLKGLDQAISQAANIKVFLDSDPLTTVVRGAGKVLMESRKFEDVFIN